MRCLIVLLDQRWLPLCFGAQFCLLSFNSASVWFWTAHSDSELAVLKIINLDRSWILQHGNHRFIICTISAQIKASAVDRHTSISPSWHLGRPGMAPCRLCDFRQVCENFYKGGFLRAWERSKTQVAKKWNHQVKKTNKQYNTSHCHAEGVEKPRHHGQERKNTCSLPADRGVQVASFKSSKRGAEGGVTLLYSTVCSVATWWATEFPKSKARLCSRYKNS